MSSSRKRTQTQRRTSASHHHIKKKSPDKKSPASIKSKKSVLDSLHLHSEIPTAYSESFLHAMVRDPHWVFLYWELTDSSIQSAFQELGIQEQDNIARRIIRLLDVTDIIYNGHNAWRTFDTSIDNLANNWYLKIPEPGRNYLVELGLLHLDGRFTAMLRSNTVSIPRDTADDSFNEEWVTVNSAKLRDAAWKSVTEDSRSSEAFIQSHPYFGSGNNG